MPYVERVTKAGNTIEIERYFTSRYKKKGISRGDKVKPTKEEQEYAKTGETTGKGVFTIVEVKAGQGASAGWGRLKSGAGWISLDYATRLA